MTPLPPRRTLLRREEGSATVEALLAVPVLVACLAFVTVAGQLAHAAADVAHAAGEGARTATLHATVAAARTDATATVTANLTATGVTCDRGHHVAVTTPGLVPGGHVTVQLTCTATLAAIAGVGLPGTHTFTATSTEVIDTYRADP